MATVRSIAKKLNISGTTVSRALNNRSGISQKTRELILKTAQEEGYDRRVGLRASRYVGFVYPAHSFRGDIGMYHSALFGGIFESLTPHKFDFALVNLLNDKKPNETYRQFFERKELKGVILQAHPEDLTIVRAIAKEKFPMVLVASHLEKEQTQVNWVACDSKRPTKQAVKYLLGLGHRRIAFITGKWHDSDLDDRYEGYIEAMGEAGIEPDPGLFFRTGPSVMDGVTVMRQLMGLPEPITAVICTTQYVTMGAIRACREKGIRVPEDLSIIGFDDKDMRFLSNPIYSSVCQDATQLGFEAGQALMRLIEDETQAPIQITHTAVFEVHDTTAPPPSSTKK
ncbi:MAG: LacI family DNA-binding transcriptional regulator [Verrucomicrobia bacterium]|nr:LacI family DNA-binding transcriptional regulator [Verrucomicrobiota bacterium]MCH8528031.1 LacI family transcriptional regulator [Kiritimatiellia bacterium]